MPQIGVNPIFLPLYNIISDAGHKSRILDDCVVLYIGVMGGRLERTYPLSPELEYAHDYLRYVMSLTNARRETEEIFQYFWHIPTRDIDRLPRQKRKAAYTDYMKAQCDAYRVLEMLSDVREAIAVCLYS